MTLRVLLRTHPRRVIALATDTHVLSFSNGIVSDPSASTARNPHAQTSTNIPQASCVVEFQDIDAFDLQHYRTLTSLSAHGTLGLVTINGDVFVCLVNGASKVATVRPDESIHKITSVDFYCINRADHDAGFENSAYGLDGNDDILGARPVEASIEHPCLALKKLLSGSSFFYSADFDLTKRLQDRISSTATIALDSLDGGLLWNAFMIQPLVNFRSRLSPDQKQALDDSRILTSAIRGFAMTIPVPAAASPVDTGFSGMPSTITLISRLSSRRAGTRFNSRGIDDDGNVANAVETETVFCAPSGLCFSYVQVRGSIPVFWEQAAGFTPAQQKVQLTRPAEATQPAFDKHFAELQTTYGAVHIVNLLSNTKAGEVALTQRYRQHVQSRPLNAATGFTTASMSADHQLLLETDYDFHAETRNTGYEAASGIKQYLFDSSESFVYFLSEEVKEDVKIGSRLQTVRRSMTILQQQGVFRTNCLDCLDRTNLVQTIISRMALEELLRHRGERRSSADFLLRHSTLWADNGDALSKIYAGTGALKSSFTRSGKMSFAGALADVRKSATRLYINNFEDKGRQHTIDMLLGRLMGQSAVQLFDPVHDSVNAELQKRSTEYTTVNDIHIVTATFNLNGRIHGVDYDLSPWLWPRNATSSRTPEIFAIGFQEIVELSPQQIMSTDPNRRLAWEKVLKKTLNAQARTVGKDEYILLRSGQLVGASLSVYVKTSALPHIKSVEGSMIKTGLSGMAGNKGAVAIRLEYANTSLCLVTAHLAAGFANYEERNTDYRTISQGLRFQRDRGIEDHDAIIWFGDFNYRIGMNNERVRQAVKSGDYATLYANDQLNLQMVHGKTFPHYNEARVTFPPTYKYNAGTDEYDTSEKQRIPAWTDRVLCKGNSLEQLQYHAATLRFSDHRPVYASFRCTVSRVDEKTKTAISDQLFAQSRKAVTDDLEHGADLIDATDPRAETDGTGLLPASSDKRKWWLDGGLPARSDIDVTDELLAAELKKPANPFAPGPEELLPSDSPEVAPRLPSRGRQSQPAAPANARPPVPHKPAVLRHRSRSRSSGSKTTENQKTAHHLLVPSKSRPVLKRNDSSSSKSTYSAVIAVPFPPPPRRSNTPKIDTGSLGRPKSAGSTGGNIMDERGGGGGLAAWEPLKPS